KECTFVDFMMCSRITFSGNEGAVGLIKWIEKTEMVFTVRKCTEANKVVFAAATFQDQALTWWNSQVATLGIEVVTRKTWAEIKVLMTEEFCPPEEIQRIKEPVKVNHSYEVELADGRVVSTNTILRGCALNLVNHLFEIDLMPIELATFDVIIKTDWLILHDAIIVCGKKEVHVPLKKRTLVVNVVEKEPIERRLEDVPVICKFPDGFSEDLPGLPPPRQVEFE
nr:reverse transcriptase domain-containing protein [Tanacetum cinerariifolium]